MKMVVGLPMELTPVAILCDSSHAVDAVQCNSELTAHTMVDASAPRNHRQ